MSGRIWPWLFFVGLLLLGLSIVRDYGVYLDEFTNHVFGVTWYHYLRDIVVHHAPLAPLASATEHDVIHGPVFEMALAWIEDVVLHGTDLREIVVFRHYATWAFFYVATVLFYLLARRLWNSRPLALFATLFLVIHPRIFAHSFYDSVDISFLALYTASMWTLVRYLDRRTCRSLCLHAVMCGLAIDVRIIGGAMAAITVGLLGLEMVLSAEGRRRVGAGSMRIAVFVALVVLTTVAFWPYLWTNPWERAVEILRVTPKINWNGLVLYLGRDIPAPELPWHYIPVWIAITTPIACSVLFLVGVVELFSAAVRNPMKCYRTRLNELAIAAAFLLPLGSVLLMHAVVYDSWRHLFFIYPAFVLIAIVGFRAVLRWSDGALSKRTALVVKSATVALIVLNLAVVGGLMIRNHPDQTVYFNRLAGRDLTEIKRRFELDFWGVSYLRALNELMARDPANPLRIHRSGDGLLAVNRYLLSAADQARIQEVELEAADYAITNFRQRLEGYPAFAEDFSISVEGEKIVCVYRRR